MTRHSITGTATSGEPMVTCDDKPPSRAWGSAPDWRCPWCGAAPVTTEIPNLEAVGDVTDTHLAWAEEVADTYFPDTDEPIDWEDFTDHFADPNGYGPCDPFDITEYDNPAMRKIQRHVRKYRKD